jgi:hypothetical protein
MGDTLDVLKTTILDTATPHRISIRIALDCIFKLSELLPEYRRLLQVVHHVLGQGLFVPRGSTPTAEDEQTRYVWTPSYIDIYISCLSPDHYIPSSIHDDDDAWKRSSDDGRQFYFEQAQALQETIDRQESTLAARACQDEWPATEQISKILSMIQAR